MITVTKLNNQPMLLNPDHIESVTSNPDTSILLTNGKTLVVLESMQIIQRKVIHYRREISNNSIFDDNNNEQA